MDYSFNCDIAAMCGVEEAVFIHNLYWWIRKNEANGRHHYDGKTWTYNSMKAFSELFPFWTERQVRRIIKNLTENGYLVQGNYNKAGFDRTKWYALSDEIYEIYGEKKDDQNVSMHLTEQSNGSDRTVEPIPDSKPDSFTTTAATRAEDVQMLGRYWEENGFGRNIRAVWDKVQWWLDDGASAPLIRRAMEEAALCGKQNWRYVDSILERCRTQKITTPEQFDAEKRKQDADFKERGTKTGGRTNARAGTDPRWRDGTLV